MSNLSTQLSALADAISHQRDVSLGVLVDTLREAAGALSTLLAERDGLKIELTAIREAIAVKGGNEHMPTYDAYMGACSALHKKDAALADALGLLGETCPEDDPSTVEISMGWRQRRNDFLAKHGPSP